MGGDGDMVAMSIGYKRFNPRPRMGGDASENKGEEPRRVSIHAPVWGATRMATANAAKAEVSIHAPVWGATSELRQEYRHGCGFNPRPRMGGDGRCSGRARCRIVFQSTPPYGGRPLCAGIINTQAKVSIHAPVWGATHEQSNKHHTTMFQSTPPYGGRHRRGARHHRRTIRFNPRPRMGGDPPGQRFHSLSLAFQSTPPYGGRQEPLCMYHPNNWFQSTPPYGGRL